MHAIFSTIYYRCIEYRWLIDRWRSISRSTAFDNRQPLIIDRSLWDVICILIQRHIAWAKNSIDYSLYVYSRLPYFKGLAETRVHLPHLELDVDVDGCYAAIYGPNNENETAGWSTIYIIQSLYMVQQPVDHFFFSSEMVVVCI